MLDGFDSVVVSVVDNVLDLIVVLDVFSVLDVAVVSLVDMKVVDDAVIASVVSGVGS